MTDNELLYSVTDNTARITINREASRNAITPAMIRSFLDLLDQVEADDAVRILVITGGGEKAFCAGADLAGAIDGGKDGALSVFKDYAALLKRLARFSKPTVARVNGNCIAGGTGFMLACDLVVAVDTARFGTPEVNVGLFPMMIGALIFSHVPRKQAMEMMLLGELFDAKKALQLGMVNRVVPAEKLDAEVDGIAAALAVKSPIGLKLGKKALAAAEALVFEDAVDYLATQLMAVMETEDAVEGVTAFLERRKPAFKGK
ncbi:MAG: enoyl-CoA hydratase-related protein [Thermodesulfobacteriota bacterium]|nr:enoyl-CoA hydratase-related protein [Thermodesulfobacteriota bacterium]